MKSIVAKIDYDARLESNRIFLGISKLYGVTMVAPYMPKKRYCRCKKGRLCSDFYSANGYNNCPYCGGEIRNKEAE